MFINLYISPKFLKKTLESAFNKKVKICDFNFEPLGGNGENFCGQIYSVICGYNFLNAENQTEGELEYKKLILKILSKEMAGHSSSELVMYESILSGMELELSAIGLNTKFKPKCFLIDKNDGNEVYALEDLCELGFMTGNRFDGLNTLEAKVLLKKLAEFHATSMVYLEKNPEIISYFATPFLERGDTNAITKSIVNDGMLYAANLVSEWENFNEIGKKMKANISTFFDRIRSLTNLQNCNIKVINHGDLWVNNCLLKTENGNTSDVRFVDYQGCFVGSPGYDLNYFMYTSLQLNVLKEQRIELLKYYYEHLENVLKRFQFNIIPSWQQLLDEVNNYALIGYYAAVSELPICCMNEEVSKGFTATTFTNEEAMALKRPLMYKNPRVLETLRYVLQYFNEMSILN